MYERGAVQATCHVRGGGDFGEEWHLAGKKDTKPNTWKDFIACAEYLIAKGYTSPAHLAGEGGSAGGILIGRAIEERPDLFAAAVADVPAADMLRQETTANGVPNIGEFGSTKTEDGFSRALCDESVRQCEGWRAVSGGAGDDRDQRSARRSVGACQVRRAAAGGDGERQARAAPTSTITPVMASRRVKTSVCEHAADMWSFLLWQTGRPGISAEQTVIPARDLYPTPAVSRRPHTGAFPCYVEHSL